MGGWPKFQSPNFQQLFFLIMDISLYLLWGFFWKSLHSFGAFCTNILDLNKKNIFFGLISVDILSGYYFLWVPIQI